MKYILMFFISCGVIVVTIFCMWFFGKRHIKVKETGGNKTDLLFIIAIFVLFFATYFLFSGLNGIINIL